MKRIVDIAGAIQGPRRRLLWWPAVPLCGHNSEGPLTLQNQLRKYRERNVQLDKFSFCVIPTPDTSKSVLMSRPATNIVGLFSLPCQ